MTRVLSELLGAREPDFRMNLQQLELSAGRPNADIRLSAEITQRMQAKLKQLGLDPHDTTGEELYALLGERLKDDERRFAAAIQKGSTKTDDPIAHVAKALMRHITPRSCFAMKPAAAKRLLKANLPKKTMKALSYRSADSMLKHESPASLFAAAWLTESEGWCKRMVSSYAKLKATDFEIRHIAIEHPVSKRWQALADSVVAAQRHNILSFRELGSVVLLPLPENKPELPSLTTAVLAVHAINEIHVSSTYLKLHQVQPNFGTYVRDAALGKSVLAVRLLDQPVSWSVVQRYYARFAHVVQTDIFEPVIQAEDFVWHSVEQIVSAIEPALEFWHGTSYLARQAPDGPVSCNLTDQVLAHCNNIPYHLRFLGQFRHELSTELSLRYLSYERLQQAITPQLQNQLALQPATA